MTEEHRTLPAAEAEVWEKAPTYAGWLVCVRTPAGGYGIRAECGREEDADRIVADHNAAFLALPVADAGDEGLVQVPALLRDVRDRLAIAELLTDDEVVADELTINRERAGALCDKVMKALRLVNAALNARSAPASDAGLREALEKIANWPSSQSHAFGARLIAIARTALDAQKGETK